MKVVETQVGGGDRPWDEVLEILMADCYRYHGRDLHNHIELTRRLHRYERVGQVLSLSTIITSEGEVMSVRNHMHSSAVCWGGEALSRAESNRAMVIGRLGIKHTTT